MKPDRQIFEQLKESQTKCKIHLSSGSSEIGIINKVEDTFVTIGPMTIFTWHIVGFEVVME